MLYDLGSDATEVMTAGIHCLPTLLGYFVLVEGWLTAWYVCHNILSVVVYLFVVLTLPLQV